MKSEISVTESEGFVTTQSKLPDYGMKCMRKIPLPFHSTPTRKRAVQAART